MSNSNENEHYNNEKYKECKGCVIIKNCSLKPRFESNGIIEECPCATCLVKGICSPICKSFNDYVDLHPPCESKSSERAPSDNKDENHE